MPVRRPEPPSITRLNEFSYSQIPIESAIQLIGKRGSGKTKLLEELMESMAPKFDYAFAMTPTESTRQMLIQHMPEWCVLKPSVANLEKIRDIAKERCRKRERKGKKRESWLLVLDDLAMCEKVMKSEILGEFFMNGRHDGCTIILTNQYVKKAVPAIRVCTDWVFAFFEDNMTVRKALFEEYMAALGSDFKALFEKYTENFGTLVVNKKVATRNPLEKFFHKRAKPNPPPSFRIGYKIMHRLDDCYIDPDDSASTVSAAAPRPILRKPAVRTPHNALAAIREDEDNISLGEFEFPDE